MKIKAWIDGACKGNGTKESVGGWAVIIEVYDSYDLQIGHREISGQVENTTNNRMELKALIECLGVLDTNHPIEIVTDSLYVRDGVARLPQWIADGWRRKDGHPTANADLWRAIKLMLDKYENKPVFTWVRGHDVDIMNNRVDSLAREAAEKKA